MLPVFLIAVLAIKPADIGGVVSSTNGPEAGVWVSLRKGWTAGSTTLRWAGKGKGCGRRGARARLSIARRVKGR